MSASVPGGACPERLAAELRARDERVAQLERENAKLLRVKAALIDRVERSLDRQGGAFSLFQTAIGLEDSVRQRTLELEATLADLERSNTDLERARDAAERASRTKTHFIAAASHDVLQPLNAASLSMSSLAAVQGNAEGRRLCAQVERSLDTMDTLLRTLLYMSRLDAGDVVPRIEPVSLDALFESIASDFEPVARQRRLELRVRRSGLHVRSDATMLRRILQNIVANALRYTSSGGVLLVASAHGSRVRVRIADTGIGIPKAHQRDVFVEFRRLSAGPAMVPVASRDTEAAADENRDEGAGAGLGLGLAIVDRLARALGHGLALNSSPGHGTCFSLAFERSAAPAAPEPLAPRPATAPGTSLDGARVLLVENDPDALRAMVRLLRQWGCDPRPATGQAAALDALESPANPAAAGTPPWRPDLIVADQHLDGDERGTEVIAALRRRLGAEVAALVVTANPSRGLQERAARTAIELMDKPLKPARLRALLTHMRGRATPSGTTPASTARGAVQASESAAEPSVP